MKVHIDNNIEKYNEDQSTNFKGILEAKGMSEFSYFHIE